VSKPGGDTPRRASLRFALFFPLLWLIAGLVQAGLRGLPLRPGDELGARIESVAATLVGALAAALLLGGGIRGFAKRYRIAVDRWSVPQLLAGIAGAAAFVGVVILVESIAGPERGIEWARFDKHRLLEALAYTAVVACFEEFAFRGFLLATVLWVATPLRALLVTSTLFALAHVFVDSASGASGLVDLAPQAALGVLLCLLSLATGRIWLGVGLHWGIDALLSLAGTRTVAPGVAVLSRAAPPIWLEDVIITVLAAICALVLLGGITGAARFARLPVLAEPSDRLPLRTS
jgi:membrane protease YdiL (CAAX protease family)